MSTEMPPTPLKKKGLSTGCIVALVLGLIAFVGLGIVGILAAIAIPTGKVVLQKARAVQAKAVLTNLLIGVKGYDIEYNHFPVSDGESAPLQVHDDWLEALLGNELKLNPRKVRFLEIQTAKPGTGGLAPAGSGHVVLDPWGNPYVMLMDTNGDGKINNPEKPGSTLPQSVIGWSAGPDGDYTTWEDNIVSWR